MIRFSLINGSLKIDKEKKGGGRGVYICFDEDCFKKARKKGFPFSYREVDEWLRS